MEGSTRPASIDAPRGFHQARVDEKGRLKLPSVFQQFLKELGEYKVFVTTLDISTIRIYPISLWEQNEKFFEESDEPELAENVSFLANHFGADSEIDSQGRVLVPTELRRRLGVENQPVWLGHHKGRIDVLGKAQYDERLARAEAAALASLRPLEKKGLK